MTIADNRTSVSKINGAIDITKLIMAILVIGIHTEPFGFNKWLDNAFGICIRFSVPFFFVTSAYLFWKKDKPLKSVLKRIAILYVVWSIIYLPFDIAELSRMSFLQILDRFLWSGNNHALWYLCASIYGFIITYTLLKFLTPKSVLIIAVVVLVIGTVLTTYSTAVYQLFKINLPNHLRIRNGLFYGFPYITLGMTIAKSDTQGIYASKHKIYIGFFVSLCLFIAECYLFGFHFKAKSTVLWLSLFPCIYFFFEIVLNTTIMLDKSLSITFRKMSTLMYVSHRIFISIFSKYSSYFLLFVLTVLAAALFSIVIIKLSEKKGFGFLKFLY